MTRIVSQNGTRSAVATTEVTAQQQVLRQLQNSMQELQTRFVAAQRHLGSASSALQVRNPGSLRMTNFILHRLFQRQIASAAVLLRLGSRL